MRDKKQTEYTVKILAKIQELFDESKDFMEELEVENNATDFIHALANIVPTSVYGTLTKKDISLLDFNHIANRLCFQNSKLIR